MTERDLYSIRFRDGWREPPQPTLEQVNFIETALKITPNHRILDLACGYGRHALELARRGHRVVGLDSSSLLVQEARDRAEQGKLPAEFVQGDMLQLDYVDEFDVVYLMDVSFGLFADDQNRLVLRHISRALRKGGLLLLDLFNPHAISAVVRTSWVEIDEKLFLIENRFDPLSGVLSCFTTVIDALSGTRRHPAQRIRIYTLPELRGMLKDLGLLIERVYGSSEDVKEEYQLDSRKMVVQARNASNSSTTNSE